MALAVEDEVATLQPTLNLSKMQRAGHLQALYGSATALSLAQTLPESLISKLSLHSLCLTLLAGLTLLSSC